MERLKNMPVPLLPTMVGAMTLSNVYSGLGYTAIRHITMCAGIIVLLLYIVKIIKFFPTVKEEYNNTVLASLYAGFTMMMMLIGSYIFDFNAVIGKGIWFAALILHTCHILLFTYKNVIKKRDVNTFLPSWFVTYNGVMVSIVIGGVMNEAALLTIYTYYGIVIYFVLICLLLVRLNKYEIKPNFMHTLAIVLAPCALCLVSYLNTAANPIAGLVYLLYACVVASLVFIIIKLPKFFSVPFAPGFAGMTFPMAIGTVASSKMAAYLANAGNEGLSAAVAQLSGIQIYLTSMLVGYVLLNFIMMALKVKKAN
ncbi:MAG: TDT family transporter [Eubacteriales bacterium]